jgi:hypothetical protein
MIIYQNTTKKLNQYTKFAEAQRVMQGDICSVNLGERGTARRLPHHINGAGSAGATRFGNICGGPTGMGMQLAMGAYVHQGGDELDSARHKRQIIGGCHRRILHKTNLS